jgi:EAL domain-containing protein (putative c-di-GMP-specific phosphodiesterase class I)
VAIPVYRVVREEVVQILRERGGLGAVLIDLSPLALVERSLGAQAYQKLRAQIDPIMMEVKERARVDDLLALEGEEGERVLLFLTGRRVGVVFTVDELRKLADRIEDFLVPRVARLTQPFLRERPTIDIGYGFVLFNPLANDERQIQRLIDEARQCAELRHTLRLQKERDALREIVYNRSLWTAFQPIVEITEHRIMGYEALSRGPRGTDVEPPMALFSIAGRHGLVEELERCCRRQAFIDWERSGLSGRLFVNTVPATVRDPSFLGRGVIDFLGPSLSPQRVTLEITERQVIENLTLYREAMHSFLEMGFSFAIDDLGAGYSGLETLVSLGAAYLKIDMGLVRDVHQRQTNQKVVKAIVELGAGVGATVIAEGIQTEEESETLLALGVRFGQGYHLGRPLDVASFQGGRQDDLLAGR